MHIAAAMFVEIHLQAKISGDITKVAELEMDSKAFEDVSAGIFVGGGNSGIIDKIDNVDQQCWVKQDTGISTALNKSDLA